MKDGDRLECGCEVVEAPPGNFSVAVRPMCPTHDRRRLLHAAGLPPETQLEPSYSNELGPVDVDTYVREMAEALERAVAYIQGESLRWMVGDTVKIDAALFGTVQKVHPPDENGDVVVEVAIGHTTTHTLPAPPAGLSSSKPWPHATGSYTFPKPKTYDDECPCGVHPTKCEFHRAQWSGNSNR